MLPTPKAPPFPGLRPRFLMFNADSIASQTRREFGGDVTAALHILPIYYQRIWQKQPGRLPEKVTGQMLMFYVPYCRAYDPRFTRNLGDQYQLGVVSLSDPMCRKVWSAYSPAVDFMTRTEELARRGLR